MGRTFKLWHACTTTILLLLTIQFTMQGFFRPKAILDNKTEPERFPAENERKVIMFLVDALREDYVELDETALKHAYLTPDMPTNFQGQRLSLFKRMREENPRNSFLVPLESSNPTVTSVRIKSVLNGGLSTFFETTEEFVSSEIVEDNILFQLKHRRDNENNTVIFVGDHIWSPLYGKYFDETYEFASLNTRDLDSIDNSVQERLTAIFDDQTDFKLMIVHAIGVDSAGHTYGSQNEHIERKLLDTELMLE